MEKLEIPSKTNKKSSTTWLDSTKRQLEVLNLPEVIDENWILTIDWLANAMWKKKEKKTLPNGKEIITISRDIKDLPQVYKIVDEANRKNNLSSNDLVTIDWACPGRLLTTITHALHPANVDVKYPQWWPNTKLPVTWFEMKENGKWQDLEFKVTENEGYTLVEFSLANPNINAQETIKSLIAPDVSTWKPVVISWRWPIAILTAIADAYAHKVPYVACFQPGTGNVVAISHSDVNLGTIIEN